MRVPRNGEQINVQRDGGANSCPGLASSSVCYRADTSSRQGTGSLQDKSRESRIQREEDRTRYVVRYTVLADCALALGREDMGLVPKLGGGGAGVAQHG